MKIVKYILFFIVFVANQANAQLQKIIHQTFELDDIEVVTIDLKDQNYVIETWAGNTILTETKVRWSYGTSTMMDYIISGGRYEIVTALNGNALAFKPKAKDRPTLKFKDKDTEETVLLRIFVPEDYSISEDKKTLKKRIENLAKTN